MLIFQQRSLSLVSRSVKHVVPFDRYEAVTDGNHETDLKMCGG